MRISRFQASCGTEAGSQRLFPLDVYPRRNGPACILFNISPVTGLNCRAESRGPGICILIGPYYGNVVATVPVLGWPWPASRLTTRRNTQPSRARPLQIQKRFWCSRAVAAARIVASLIASYRIIEPIHSREYAHLIDSHCCRSFIASATNCARLSKLSYSLARSTPVSCLSLSLSLTPS